ncbi:MAG: hypothetical protein DLD55_03310 [candidate division SR1 bacterium]|nr:MAG: hypothetical protein DLD55_03310 [candidate division SR1 bacterium]
MITKYPFLKRLENRLIKYLEVILFLILLVLFLIPAGFGIWNVWSRFSNGENLRLLWFLIIMNTILIILILVTIKESTEKRDNKLINKPKELSITIFVTELLCLGIVTVTLNQDTAIQLTMKSLGDFSLLALFLTIAITYLKRLPDMEIKDDKSGRYGFEHLKYLIFLGIILMFAILQTPSTNQNKKEGLSKTTNCIVNCLSNYCKLNNQTLPGDDQTLTGDNNKEKVSCLKQELCCILKEVKSILPKKEEKEEK